MSKGLGDKLKAVEQVEAGRRANRSLPLMARLDGKAFHTLTKDMKRPFDAAFSQLMIETTKFLCSETHAKLAFTQSDEITLFWVNESEESEFLFGGKFQKLTSVLASMAGAFFSTKLVELWTKNRQRGEVPSLAFFDCRVWSVGTMNDVFENFLWRQQDATKNSISMAAHSFFGAKKLEGVPTETKKQLLRTVGFVWEDQPPFFKLGTFVGRVKKLVELTKERLEKMPARFRPMEPVVERKEWADLGVASLIDKETFERLLGLVC